MSKKSWFDVVLIQLDEWSLRILRLMFLVLLLIGVYISYDMYYIYTQADKDSLSIFKPEEVTDDSLKEISKDAIGWITLDDTNIDYPIMQGKDNIEYLNKAPDGTYRISGSIFLDSRNHKDFTDPYNIIYGHHMAGGYMFGSLDEFKDEKYFMSHRTGSLEIPSKKFKVHVVGFLITDAQVDEVFDTDIKDESTRLPVFEKQALWWDDDGKGTLVVLTTCKEPLTTARFALICRIR
jgi:sortase B